MKKTKGTKGTNSISDKVVREVLLHAFYVTVVDLETVVQTNFISPKVWNERKSSLNWYMK